MKNQLTPLHLFLIILLGGIAYANTYNVPFVLDDLESIVNNTSIRSLGNFLPGGSGLDFHFRRSVAYFTFALNYRFGGLSVSGYHFCNFAVHLGSALLVYAMVRLILRTPRLAGSFPPAHEGTVALLAALVFVVHPVQTQAVTYIVQRLTSLCTFFYLLSLVLYLLARLRLAAAWQEKDARPGLTAGGLPPLLLLAGAVTAAILAIFTKEIAFTLPFAALLCELSFFHGGWRQRLPVLLPLLLTLPIIPFLVLTGGELSAAGTLQQTRIDIPRWHYLLTQFPVIATYLRLLVWPTGQNLDYDYPIYTTPLDGPVILALGLLLTLLGLASWLWWRTREQSGKLDAGSSPAASAGRLVAFGIFWFFLTLSVESSVMPLADVIFEHRLYLPLVGLCIALAAAIALAMQATATTLDGRLPLLVAAVVIVALTVATWQRNRVWQSEVSLWADTVRKSPEKVRPLYNYGFYLTEAGRVEEAIRLLTQVVQRDPRHADAWHNLGRGYLLLGRDREALPPLRTAVRLAPTLDNATLNLSSALLRTGNPAEARILLEGVLARSPNWPEVRFSLGLAHLGVGDIAAARRELNTLQRLHSPLAGNLATIIARAEKSLPR